MSIKIKQIFDKDEKSTICEKILRDIPEWFGLEEATLMYKKKIEDQITFVAYDGELAVGFLGIAQHFDKSYEIYVMGVLKKYHRQGIGRLLVVESEEYIRTKGAGAYLQVKTLSGSHPDKGYAKTRAFYEAMGFVPLEEFKTLWDENNPCLVYIKSL